MTLRVVIVEKWLKISVCVKSGIVTQFWHRVTILATWHDFVTILRQCVGVFLQAKSWHDFDRSKTLFKLSMTHLLGEAWWISWKPKEGTFRVLDTKGGGSLGEVQSFKMWILENQKRGLFGKWLVPFLGDSWGWETHEWRVCVRNLGESWETKREDP